MPDGARKEKPACGTDATSRCRSSRQKVRTLVEGWQPTGTPEVAWDGRDAVGRNMASGVYMIRTTTGDFQSVKRMTLVR